MVRVYFRPFRPGRGKAVDTCPAGERAVLLWEEKGLAFSRKNESSREARLLLAEALCREFPEIEGLPPMEKDVWGKPFFPDYPHIYFSLSHTGTGVCCALGSAPVGVDVEERRPRKYQEQILRRFSREEQRLWDQTPPKERERLFFQLWVLKESYVKADGRGLRIPLDSFSVLPMDWEACWTGNGMPQAWSMAVADEGGEKEYDLRLYDMEEFSSVLAVCSLDKEIAEQVCMFDLSAKQNLSK